jgi:hypothetical protein
MGSEITAKRLWLDDVRTPPGDWWVWAKTVEEAIEVLEAGTVVEASLDNDLYPFERDGVEVVEWMADHQVFPRLVTVHSDNEAASDCMCGLLVRCGYHGVPGRPRHFIKSDGTRISPEDFARISMKYSRKSMERLR